MSQEFKNWGEYKEALLDGLNEKQTAMLGTMMESTHSDLANANDQHNTTIVEAAEAGSTSTGNISRFDMMFMPLIRRTMPSLLAMDLVGVQPLTSSRGIVRTLRTRYAEETLATSGGSVQVAAGAEATGQVVHDKYSKLVLGDDYDGADAMNPFEQTAYMEGNRGKPLNLDVVTDSVETGSRKLSAAYSLEAADDLMAYDGLDIEAELSQSLGDEILRDLDRELITELTSLAGSVNSFDFANVDGRYAGEKLSAMLIAIDNLSAQIAVKTKKAGATWIVVSQKVFTGMKNASNSTFVPAGNGDIQITSTLYVGTLGGNIKVYVDPYAEVDSILMGGKYSEIDSGLIYCPYIPLSSSGVVRNPDTGDFRVMMRTRYGLHSFTDTATSLGNSSDYYARATVANISLGFSN
ncbi:MAG: hypothetical protein PF440_02580 [Thiomicrorhabdus sp.]|jgi:hypothetical protein|nr:hypothetical protein [Thiomicrorhabdus sp.]